MESEKILPFNLALQKKLHLHVPSNKSEQRPSILDLPELIYVTRYILLLILLMEAENIFQCTGGVWGHRLHAADIFFGKTQINHRSKCFV